MRGQKESNTEKQKRQARHLQEGDLEKGESSKKAESTTWPTVKKEAGVAKKRKKPSSRKAESKSNHKSRRLH